MFVDSALTPVPTRSRPGAMGRLPTLSSPAELRAMSDCELSTLAAEIRVALVDNIARTGGHLGSNLGMVELTLALHRVFDSPRDPLLFDTGHQAYVHKLLTGRAGQFHSLRRAGGLSGYPSREESEHDQIENSHASTALSYAHGLAVGHVLAGERDRTVVAIVGDGTLTGGPSWEALNNLAASAGRVVIVLNDNGRSYGPTVGGLANHLATMANDHGGENLFTMLGLGYEGPVDGHDRPAVEAALQRASERTRADGPVVVHCLTVKGQGYCPAEDDEADHMHSTGAFDPRTGLACRTSPRSWTTAFGDEIVRQASIRNDLVALTAAMLLPTGLGRLAEVRPDRVIDVGIAEAHAMTTAAGLAMSGLHPVVALYSTFLNRAFDQLLLDVALHRLPVTLVLDRAGVTGDDGPSHHGLWDLTLLRTIPGMRIAAPRDEATLRDQLATALATSDGPTALRFPKGAIPEMLPALYRYRGDAGPDVLSAGCHEDVLVVGVGPMAGVAVAAAETAGTCGVTVVDPRWIYPVGPELCALARRHRSVLIIEDSAAGGGAAESLRRELGPTSSSVDIRARTLPRLFHPHGSRDSVLASNGVDVIGIAGQIDRLRDTSAHH